MMERLIQLYGYKGTNITSEKKKLMTTKTLPVMIDDDA